MARRRLSPQGAAASVPFVAAATLLFSFLSFAGCGAPQVPSSPAAAPAQPLSNNDPPEATLATAGLDDCLIEGPFPLVEAGDRRAVRDLGVSLAFGAWGGLAVWPGPKGTRARLLTPDGSPLGEVRDLELPFSFGPEQIVPVEDGFVLLATETLYAAALCERACPDPFCWSWSSADGPTPQVCTVPCMKPCSKPSGSELRALFVPIVPGPVPPPAEKEMQLADVVVVSASRERTFLFLTSAGALFTANVGVGGEVGLSRLAFPRAGPYLLPVRGSGKPSFLAVNRRGVPLLASTDELGSVTGETIAENGEHVRTARLQARWAQDGRIHVAWREHESDPPSMHYAVLDETHDLQMEGATQPVSAGIRAPFEDYVVADRAPLSSIVKRRSWTGAPAGRPFDLAYRDPDIDTASIVQAWTGTHFVFAYARKGDPAATWLLRARCAQGE